MTQLQLKNASLSVWQKLMYHLKCYKYCLGFPKIIVKPNLLLFSSHHPTWQSLLKMDWGIWSELKKMSSDFIFFFYTLTPKCLSWRQQYQGLSLTDMLWHKLSLADMRTAEGFDSVHSEYPAPSGGDQKRHLSAPPAKHHISLSPPSKSGNCTWMLTLQHGSGL